MCAVVVQQQYHWTCSRTENSKKKTKQSVFIGLTVNWFTDLPLRCVRAFNCCSPSLTPQLTDFTQCKLTAANYAKVKQTQVCMSVLCMCTYISCLYVLWVLAVFVFTFMQLFRLLLLLSSLTQMTKENTYKYTHTQTNVQMYVCNCVFISIIENLLGNSWVSAR